MFNIRKKLAIMLVAAIVVGQCGVSVLADEQLTKAVSKNAKLITVTTESDAEYDDASDAATDATDDDDYTSSSNAKYSKASSSNAKYINASSSDADYEDDIDFVPEQLLVSVRGGLDGLYFTVDENQDTTFLDDFTFESLAVIDDKYDRGNDIVEVVGEPEENAPDEVDFSDDSDEEKSAGITEYQVFKVTVPGYKTRAQLNALASKIEKLPAVQYAELNKVIRLASINSNDGTLKGVDRQWAYKYQQGKYSMGVTDPDYSGTDKIINWDEYKDPTVASPSAAPKIKTTTNDPVVVVIDCGIDYTHEDLDDVMWNDSFGLGGGTYGYDATAAVPSGKEPMDDYGHGTHCAGIIAAEWNGIGVSGITSGVKLMAIKIGDANGYLFSNVYKGYEYLDKAQDAGVNVVAINCSWGGEFNGGMLNQFVARAGEKGAVSCFASGNDSQNTDKRMGDASSLSDNPYTVIVNACDSDGDLAWFSNYGLKSSDVAAPGVGIYSTINKGSAKADCCSPDTKPVKGNKNSEEKDVIDDYDEAEGTFPNVDSRYFNYTYSGNTKREYLHSKGLNNSGCIKLRSTDKNAPIKIEVNFTDTTFKNEDKPTSLGFAIRCPKQASCETLYAEAHLDGSKEMFNISYSYISNEWQNFNIDISDADKYNKLVNGKRICIYIYCRDDQKQTVFSGYDVYIDRMMFTNDAISYGIMDGTSMASPAVTGEAAILSEYFYKNSLNDKSERAKNVAARIKGSTQKNNAMKGKMQSGGMVRVDYAVHGKTDPVINDLTINKINGKYRAELHGYFFDGNAGKGENDESFVSLNIDGKNLRESNIISKNGETITFYMPSDLLTGEHLYEITSTKGTGSAYIESHVTDMAAKDRFIQIPISEKNEEIMSGIPLSMKAVNGTMYLLAANVYTNEVTLWYQNIDETLYGSNQDGEWTQVKNFANVGASKPDAFETYKGNDSMTVINNKLVGVGKKNDVWYIWEYNTKTRQMKYVDCSNILSEGEIGLYYFSETDKLFLTRSSEISGTNPQEYRTSYYMLNPNTYEYICDIDDEGTMVKRLSEIIYDGTNYYTLCGKIKDNEGDYSVEKIVFDNNGKLKEIEYVNDNVFDGVENLDMNDIAVVKSAAYINGKTIFTGPAITYDNYIEADTYIISDLNKSAMPVNKFVSTSALEYICCTIDSYGNYYVIANTKNASHNWIYAYTDTSELGKYVHKDRVIWSYDIEGSSGGNGSNTATPYYPSYVEKGGKWVKVTGADGKITWRFTDSNGQLCVNKWVAIPDEDGLTGGPFGWYRFDADGNMITGWYTDDKGRRFYLDPTEGNLKGKMKTGWILIDGKWYYFKETGKDDFGVLVPDKVKS